MGEAAPGPEGDKTGVDGYAVSRTGGLCSGDCRLADRTAAVGLAISAILTSGAIEGIAAEWRKA